jgi:integrase
MFIELGTQVGLRLGELAGLHGHRVDWLRSQITVVDVMTRQGLRQYPKSRRSHRVVPMPPDVMEGRSVLMTGRRDALCSLRRGRPGRGANFRNRVGGPPSRRPASAGSRPGSCATPPPPGW